MIHDMRFFSTAPVVANSSIKGDHSTSAGLDKSIKAISGKTDTARVSTLALQLGESAIRAEARDKSATRQQLGEFVSKSIAHLFPEPTSAKKALHDVEVPKTNDSQLLERARQATIYVNKAAAQDPTAKNPFVGLTREQATLIAYDAEGPYTTNERCAAWRHVANLEEQWRAGLMARGWQESDSTGGRVPKFMTECLDHYRALPVIEQARYDEGYEARLLTSIKEHGGPAKRNEGYLNLYEILADIQHPGKQKKDQSAVAKQPQSASKVIKDEKAPAPASVPVSAKTNEFRILTLFEILAGHRYPGIEAAKKQSEELVESYRRPALAPEPTPTTNNLSPGACPTPADARRS